MGSFTCIIDISASRLSIHGVA